MPKTILVLAANPKNTPPLRLDQEIREIDNGLERARERDGFILKQKLASRPTDVRRAMLDYKPNIVHFCGHGSGEEGIMFEDENGLARLVNANTLADFFELFSDKVECIVLNACYSEIQADALSKHIPYVIGMKKAIGDKAAIEFAVAFYDTLGAGETIEFAYKIACNAIGWAGLSEHLTPVLKTSINNAKKVISSEERSFGIENDSALEKQVLSNMTSFRKTTEFKSVNLVSATKIDIASISIIETIAQTKHSSIEKCAVGEKVYALNKTRTDLCNIVALQKLVGKEISGNEGKVTTVVAAPVAVWNTENYVWELHNFYKGITLRELILKSKYRMQGDLLSEVYNATLWAITNLHKLGILHRDISPSNILITTTDDHIRLTLIDGSFSCLEDEPQIPVENRNYSAPEQKEGKAYRQSDWYSLAATTFFLSNGIAPNQHDQKSFLAGLKNINGGGYTGSLSKEDDLTMGGMWGIASVIEALLNPELSRRLIIPLGEIIFHEITQVGFSKPTLVALLDLGDFGFIAIDNRDNYQVIQKEAIVGFLTQNHIDDLELKSFAKSIIERYRR